MTAEMDIQDVKVEDDTLMDITQKERLEKAFMAAYAKAKSKAQSIAMEKTKEIL